MHGEIARITAGKNEGGYLLIFTNLPTTPRRRYIWPDHRFFLVREGLMLPVERHASSFENNPRRDVSYFRGENFDPYTKFTYSQWGDDVIPVVLEIGLNSYELPTMRLDGHAAMPMLDTLLAGTPGSHGMLP